MPVSRRRPLFLLALLGLALLSACGTPESRKAKYLSKGRAYAAQGNWEKARVEFRNALQAMPNDAEVRYENGVAAEKLNNPREAAGLYQGALDLNADNIDARYRLARIMVLNGTPERAVELVEPGLAKHPEEPKFLTVRAVARTRTKDAAGALEDAEHAYRLAPKAEDTIAVLAGVYTSEGRRDDAIRVLEQGVVSVPDTVDLRGALVQSYVGANRAADAERVLKDLVRLQPDQPAHVMRLASFLAAGQRYPEAEAVLRAGAKQIPKAVPLKLALAQLVGRDGPAAAEKELQAQIAANPKLTELKFALAQFYADQRDPAHAQGVLEDLIKSEGTGPVGLSARNSLAVLKLRTGDVASATQLVNEVLKASPRDTQALSIRADLDMGRGDAKSAIADLRAVLRDQPNSVPTLRSLANAHVAAGEVPQAEEALRRAVDVAPGDVGTRLELVDFLRRTGRLDAAKTAALELDRDVPHNPNVVETVFKIALTQRDYAAAQATAQQAKSDFPGLSLGDYFAGLVAEAQGNWALALASYGVAVDRTPAAEDALAALARASAHEKKTAQLADRLRKLTQDKPKLAQPWQLLGEIDLGERRFADAEQSFRKAIDLSPERLAPYRGIAIARAGAGNTDGAIAALKEAQAHVSNPQEAAFELANAYQQYGHDADAIATYESILSRNPGNDAASNNLAMLLAARADAASLDRALALVQPFKASSNPRFVDTYGWVLIARKQYPEALSVLSPLVEKAPDAAAFRYHLALAQLRSGDTAAARTNLQRALQGGPNFEGGPQAQKLLEGLAKG